MSNQFPPIEIFPGDYSFRTRFPQLTSGGSDTGKWSQLPTLEMECGGFDRLQSPVLEQEETTYDDEQLSR